MMNTLHPLYSETRISGTVCNRLSESCQCEFYCTTFVLGFRAGIPAEEPRRRLRLRREAGFPFQEITTVDA